MEIKVRDGTANHGQRSLCETCRWSTVVRGRTLAEEIVECVQLSEANRRIPFVVAACSDYIDRTRPSLNEMREIALILRVKPRRNPIGYVDES